jgi:hypothetical protein
MPAFPSASGSREASSPRARWQSTSMDSPLRPGPTTRPVLVDPRPALGRWLRTSGPWDEPLRKRDAAVMLLLFLLAVLAWCATLTPLEAALGLPLSRGGNVASTGNYRDAFWHLATGLAIAIPMRNRWLYALLPMFSLGLDVDHLFGSVLPTPFPREAHDLLFLVLSSALLLVAGGRFLAGTAAAGWITHIAVDGGTFPFLAPFSSDRFALPYPVAVVAIALAGLVAFLAVRPVRALRDPRQLVPLAVTVALLALLLYWVAPGFNSFTTT